MAEPQDRAPHDIGEEANPPPSSATTDGSLVVLADGEGVPGAGPAGPAGGHRDRPGARAGAVMADTLPPEVLAKLERSAEHLGGVNRREGEPAREASAPRAELIPLSDRTPSDHPLLWTNAAYVRRPLGPGEGDDGIGGAHTWPSVEPGWSVTHARVLDADASGSDVSVARSGVVYAETTAVDPGTGESARTLHLAALPTGDGSRERGPVRVDCGWPDDVMAAAPVSWEAMRELLSRASAEWSGLSRRRALSAASADRRDWLKGVVDVLDDVRRERGWR